MKHSKLSVAGFVLLLSSCATQYGPSGITGGYSDQQIDEDSYIVSFYGNGHASEERVWNFWIYRCAELTRQKGFYYFILRRADDRSASTFDKNNNQLATFYFEQRKRLEQMLLEENASEYSVQKAYYTYYTITTYSSSARIDMYKKPLQQGMLYLLDAESIMNDIGPYVKSNGRSKLPPRDQVLLRASVEAGLRKTPST